MKTAGDGCSRAIIRIERRFTGYAAARCWARSSGWHGHYYEEKKSIQLRSQCSSPGKIKIHRGIKMRIFQKLVPLFLVLTLFGVAHADDSIKMEQDAVLGDRITPAVIYPVVRYIRIFGYKCDSVSALRKFFRGRGFKVSCNRYSYSYEVEDRGGKWIVCWKSCP